LGHAGLPLSLGDLQKGAVDAQLGAKRVRGQRAFVELLRLLEVAPADELADHLGGEGEVAPWVVPGSGERSLEVAIVAFASGLGGSAPTHRPGGGVALAAGLLLLREPEPERAEEDDHGRAPRRTHQLRVPSEETAWSRGRRGFGALPLAAGGL